MLAPYATPAGGYASLFPPVDLGYNLAAALYAAGIRATTVQKVRTEFALKLATGQGVRTASATVEQARVEAVRAAQGGPVEVFEAVARGRVTVYRRLEVVEVLPVVEAAGKGEALLIAPTGAMVEKALNLRLPVDLRVFIKRMAGSLSEIDRVTALPEVKKAIEALDYNWASISPAEVDRAFTTARAAIRGIGAGPLLPAWGEKITAGLNTVIGGVKKYMKATFTPRLSLSFNQEDQRAVEQIDEQQGWFLRDEFGRRSDALTAQGRRIVADGLRKGLGRNTIGAQLRAQLPGLWQRYGAAYANVVAANAVSRARSYSEMASYTEAGIEYLEVMAMLDERTTEICRYMDGQIISVRQCADLSAKAAAAQQPEDIYRITPFMEVHRAKDQDGQYTGERFIQTRTGTRVAEVQRSGVGNVDDRGQHKVLTPNAKLPSKGVGAPPYHHNCRSLTVPRIEMVQVPAGYSARAPLAVAPTMSCGFKQQKSTVALHKFSEKDVCSYNAGSKQVPSGPLASTKTGSTTGTNPKGAKDQKGWKPPDRTIKLPEGTGATLADHQAAINLFRGKKGAALSFKDPELIKSIKGPVLKQIAITKKTPDGVKYYTYVSPEHADAIQKEIDAKKGKPMASPPAVVPKPAPKPAPEPTPQGEPRGASAYGRTQAQDISLKDLKRSSKKYKEWAEKQKEGGASSWRVAQELAKSTTPEEFRAVAKFIKKTKAVPSITEGADYMEKNLDQLAEVTGKPGMEALTRGLKDVVGKSMHETMVATWNWGYVRTHPGVCGIHRAVQAEFGATEARVPALREAKVQEKFDKAWNKDVESAMRKWARAVYNETQRVLKEKGVKELVATRGVAFSDDTQVPDVKFAPNRLAAKTTIVTSHNYPLTAFATDEAESITFLSSTTKGVNIRRQYMITRVPAERVWSVPNSGPSVLDETEFIAIGGKDEALSLAWKGGGVNKFNKNDVKSLLEQMIE